MLSILIPTAISLQFAFSDPDVQSSPIIVDTASNLNSPNHSNESNSHLLEPTPLQWRNINISLPHNTSRQVVGYHSSADRVYLMGGSDNGGEYWSLQFNQSFLGWSRSAQTGFSNLEMSEPQQSFASSSLHNLLYIKTQQFIHIFDMEIELFNEDVIELPPHLSTGCMTVYHDPNNDHVEYLIIIGDQDASNDHATTWIYRVDQHRHNVTFFNIGPDLVGSRQHHSCAVMGGYLYVIGGVYKDTRFVEQWHIAESDGNVTVNVLEIGIMPATFTPIDTFVNRDFLMGTLPQYGHRSVVDGDRQRIYVIGGTHQNPEGTNLSEFNFSRNVLVLERNDIDGSLYEMNYMKNTEELDREQLESNHHEAAAKLIPTLPRGMAFVAPMMDRYGYLNIFGGEWAPNQTTNVWLRVSTDNWSLNGGTELDVIWKNRPVYHHNEQWALLILATMLICVCCWCKSVNRVREKKRVSNRTGVTDGSAYDEITGSSDIDDLEDDDIDDDLQDDLVPMKDPLSSDNDVTTDVDPNDPDQMGVEMVPQSSDMENASDALV